MSSAAAILKFMLNAGYHFYSHVGQEPSSSARGIMQEPTFPRTSNLSFHNPGHAELGSSFLSLLSGPPSLLQCDLQQLSNQKPFFTSNIVPVNANNIMTKAAGSDVSRAPTGLLSQIIDSKNLKTGVDLPQNVLSRAVTREKCVSAASLHDVLEAANLNQKLIVICLTGGDGHDPSKTVVKASSAAILARILVMNTNYLAQLTSQPSLLVVLQQAGFPVEENILLYLVDIWLNKGKSGSSTI